MHYAKRQTEERINAAHTPQHQAFECHHRLTNFFFFENFFFLFFLEYSVFISHCSLFILLFLFLKVFMTCCSYNFRNSNQCLAMASPVSLVQWMLSCTVRNDFAGKSGMCCVFCFRISFKKSRFSLTCVGSFLS